MLCLQVFVTLLLSTLPGKEERDCFIFFMASLLGKRELEDDLESKPILKKHKETSEEEEKETTKGFPESLQQQIKGRDEFSETKSDQFAVEEGLDATPDFVEAVAADSLQQIKRWVEFLEDTKPDETPDFVEAVAAVRKRTLFIDHVSRGIVISNIIDFFKDVAKLVRVQIALNPNGKRRSCGFVEFASANEANKALEKKNGEYLFGNKIALLAVADIAPYPPRPQRPNYCIDHKVWYEDYLLQQSLPIEEEETPPDFVEIVAARLQTLFLANLSPQTKISHIISFFEDVEVEVVSVRLIVNPEGKHVGYGFVEFAYAYEAKKALKKKNGKYLHDRKISLHLAKTAPYSPRPKYNLVEKLWYEDYLLRESRLVLEDESLEGLDETHIFVQAVALRKKTLCVSDLYHKTKISDLINFFKDVANVVHVRLAVNHKGKQLGYGFVEFASANEAKKALEKDGEYLHNRKIHLDVAKTDPPCSSPQPKYFIDHKVWYEDYLRQESLLIEEDEAVEGLDETPNFVEEVAVRKRTLFISNLSLKTKIPDIINFFGDVGGVLSVRLIVNSLGKRVGCGLVEFASANKAKEALQKKKGGKLQRHYISLDVAEIAPYPLRPKYNLAEKLWNEDCLGRENLMIEEADWQTKPNRKMKLYGVHKKVIFSVSRGKKITFSDDDE